MSTAGREPSPTAVAPARVLVVDDTPANLKLLGDLLTFKGYQVDTAPDGRQALAKIGESPPDLVLLDVMMPGLSGYDVCRAMRASPATALLPVVLVTSLDPHEERIKGIEAGADDFLGKPINQLELLARVKSLLRIKSLQDEVRRQARELRELNSTLEARVQAQVEELSSLGRLKRFFSPGVAAAILAQGEQVLAPHRREITYAFLDLRGFTAFTDKAEPEEVQGVLRAYHESMGALINEAGGTLDRFAGDGILVFFNDPFVVDDPALRACRMALRMQEVFRGLHERWSRLDYDLDLAIGIAHGYATVGAFGYESRFDYTAIGGVVNLAARLCAEARGGTVIIDRRTCAAVEGHAEVEPVGKLQLNGFAQPVSAFRLLAVGD